MRCGGARQLIAGWLLAALAVVAAGCARGPLGKESLETFRAGHASFQQGDYGAAERQFGEVVRRNPTSWALSEVCYFRGLARLQLGRREDAKKDFRRGATLYGRELTQVYSAVALANMEFEEGGDATAVHLYRQALDHPVKGLPVDGVLYRLGVSLQRLGRWREADEVLARLISAHGGSAWVGAARRRFQATHFTIQVGAFADPRNARALGEKVGSEGLPVSVSVVAAGGKTLHAVCAGRFRTHQEARASAASLKAKGYSVLVKP